MEEVPEFLATILALGSLALGKGFFFSLVLWRGFCCCFCVVLVLCLFLFGSFFVYFVCGLGGFFGGVLWVFLNVLKYVHTCIPTHVDFQVEKTLSNTHSLEFEGLYMFLITTCPFPNVFSLEQFGRTNKASS